MEEGIRRRIEQRLEELDMSARAASLQAGGSPDLLRGLLRGKQRSFRGENLARIAEVLGVSLSWLQTGEEAPDHGAVLSGVPVVGYVGAGAEAHFYDVAHSPNEFVRVPPGGNMKTIAVEVRGTSLGEIFNKWVVYYDDAHTPPTPDLYRKLCVVGLADGRVLIKQLLKGSTPGRYHLLSQTEGMIEDAEVSWAAEVRALAPR